MNIDINIFLKNYDEYTKHTSSVDRALYILLEKYKDKLPPLNDNFHKAFRQIDITGESGMDNVIWILLTNASVIHEVIEDIENGDELIR